MMYAPEHPAWKTASGASLASYFESYLQTVAYAFEAYLGIGWKIHKVNVSNSELTGGFIVESPKTRGQVSVGAFCDGKAVKLIASAILLEGRFDVHGGGSVFVDANEMARDLAHLVNGKITQLNPANPSVR